MTWRDVLDGNKLGAGKHISEAIEVCNAAGYKFLAWNGWIYFITENNAHRSGVKVEEIR